MEVADDQTVNELNSSSREAEEEKDSPTRCEQNTACINASGDSDTVFNKTNEINSEADINVETNWSDVQMEKDWSEVNAAKNPLVKLENTCSEDAAQKEIPPTDRECASKVNLEPSAEVEGVSVTNEVSNVKPSTVENPSRVTLKRKSDSLAMISSYEISSESEDDVNAAAFTKPQDPTVIINSSESESESDSTYNSESDSSSGSSQMSEEETARAGNRKKSKPGVPSSESKRLLSCLELADLPPIKDLQISVKEEECLPFGKVHSIVEILVVIESLPDVPALNLDSVLFTKTGEPLGEVFDVFGPVKRPYYTIRFNSKKDIDDKALSVGTVVYCAPKTKHTQYVFIHQLARMKGSDASWKNDLEPPIEFLDYSDDEQEKMAKKATREAKLKAKALKIIDIDAPPLKIPSFEERMNQRNTQRNQMFIRNSSPERRQKDWYNRGGGGVSREVICGPSGSGGLIRNSGFNPPIFQRHFVPPRPMHTFSQPPNSGFSQPPNSGFSQPPNSGFSQPPNAGFSQQQTSGFFQPHGLAPGGFVASRLPQERSGFFGQPRINLGQPPFQSSFGKPYLPSPAPPQSHHYPNPQYSFGGPSFSSAPPNRVSSPRPFQMGELFNGSPYLPPRSFSLPPPNSNVSYRPNMFCNNSPFSQYRHYKRN